MQMSEDKQQCASPQVSSGLCFLVPLSDGQAACSGNIHPAVPADGLGLD